MVCDNFGDYSEYDLIGEQYIELHLRNFHGHDPRSRDPKIGHQIESSVDVAGSKWYFFL